MKKTLAAREVRWDAAEGPRRFYLTTFGCQMNKHDSERLAGLLVGSGFEAVASEEAADVVIFLTCCVRKTAEDRLFGRIASMKPAKDDRPGLTIAVGGCVAEKRGRSLLDDFPHVDVVFGTDNISRLPDLLGRPRESYPVCDVTRGVDRLDEIQDPLRERPFMSWVSITKGCDNSCSYCVVPEVRGPQRSRPESVICEEVSRLAGQGVLEVTLLGQNVNSYGLDLGQSGSFARLLRRLDRIASIERIRFTTAHPKDLKEEIVEAVAESERVCEHFHLPLQSGSDRVLEAMNRGYDTARYLEMVEKIRSMVPDATITTDIIAGFPGEDAKDFEETMKLVRDVRFDGIFSFVFSARAGTAAAGMSNQVAAGEKAARVERLVEEQKGIERAKNEALVGHVFEVLVEKASRKNKGYLAGRTRQGKTVNFLSESDLTGRLVAVEITDGFAHSLKGRLC